MIKDILKIRYDIDGRIDSSETNETRTMADYLPSIPNQKDRDNAVNSEKQHEITFKDVVKKLGKVIHSDEMKDLEKSVSTLTKQELKELNKFVDTTIKPELNEFKTTLEEKGFFEKMEAFKKEAIQVIKELNQKIKEIKEKGGSKSELIKAKTQNALLTQAMITPGVTGNGEIDNTSTEPGEEGIPNL